jgi:hypothetical protein
MYIYYIYDHAEYNNTDYITSFIHKFEINDLSTVIINIRSFLV